VPSICVLDNLAAEGIALLKDDPRIQFDVRTGLAEEKLQQALNEYDGAILRSGVKITAAALEGNTRLRAIVRAGVGTDNIDKQAATRKGIVVMNTPTGNTLSTAEHAITLLLALSRNVAPAHQSLREGRWDRKKFTGAQVAGKTLGIVGIGRIGQAVATRAQALEMRVIGCDPFFSVSRAAEVGIEMFDDTAAMLPEIDYLTVHTPLTEQTRGLIGKAQLKQIKPGARLINCARGGIYDEEALLEGLKTGVLAGVALDVYESEPCTESPLFEVPGVLCTPHLGASTAEAQTQVAIEGVNLLIDFLTTGNIRHAVNMTSLDEQTLASLRGYLDLAYRLGRVVGQLDASTAESCRLEYRGDVAERQTSLLSSSFACGLLSGVLDAEPNIVSAELLLRERGIELVEDKRPGRGAFASLIRAHLTTRDGERVVAGTLFGENMPRLVQLGPHQLEAFLDGHLLIFQHSDIPGIIGAVGSICGRHGVNIAQMSVGRASPGGEAIGILNLDGPASESAIDEIAGHEAISSIRCIELPAAGEVPIWLEGPKG
jgi:D-3-phosphoglycerate dehydrogenase